MLARVTRGKVKKPYLLLVYGADGVGKTTLGSGAPNPIFLGPEQGTNTLDVERFPTPKTWDDVKLALKELLTAQHNHKTLVIDSLDWLEPLLHQDICNRYRVNSIEKAAGGYGKGYVEALNGFLGFKDQLNELREKRGMNIILIAHARIVNFNDPETNVSYERFEIKLQKNSSSMFREYVDAVLFCSFLTTTRKDSDAPNAKTRAYGHGQRVIYTERRPAFEAKNRYGLPFMILLSSIAEDSWDIFTKAAEKGEPESAKDIIGRINTMLESFDEDRREKITQSIQLCESNVKQLMGLEFRVITAFKELPNGNQ
jgi:hypothetical protein